MYTLYTPHLLQPQITKVNIFLNIQSLFKVFLMKGDNFDLSSLFLVEYNAIYL